MIKGSSLIEMLVYLACCVLLCTLAGQCIFVLQSTARERTRSLDEWLELGLALNKLLDDLRYASSNPEGWKKMTEHEIIFKLHASDCGWWLAKRRLLRVTGKYSIDSWSQRATSVVMNNVETLIFKFVKKKSAMRGVSVLIKLNTPEGQIKQLEGFTSFESSL